MWAEHWAVVGTGGAGGAAAAGAGAEAPPGERNSAAAIQRRLAHTAAHFTHFGCAPHACMQSALQMDITGTVLLTCLEMQGCPSASTLEVCLMHACAGQDWVRLLRRVPHRWRALAVPGLPRARRLRPLRRMLRQALQCHRPLQPAPHLWCAGRLTAALIPEQPSLLQNRHEMPAPHV